MTPFKYEGTFDLDVLQEGERLDTAGDQSGACVVDSSSHARSVRIDIGAWVYRDRFGRLWTTATQPTAEVSS